MAHTPFSNGQYNSSAPSPSSGDILPLQLDSSGNLKVVSSGGGGGDVNITELAGTLLGAPTTYGTAPIASVTPTFIQKGTAADSGASSTPTHPAFASTPAKGNLILVTCSFDGNDGVTLPTVSDTENGPYGSAIASFTTSGATLLSLAVFAIIATTNVNPTISVIWTGAQRGISNCYEYSGTTKVVDGTPGTATIASSASSITSSSLTTTSNNDLVIGLFGSITNASSPSAGASYTLRDHVNSTGGGITSIALEDQVQSAAGGITANITGITTGQFASIMVFALKANVPNANSLLVNAFVTNTPTVEITDGTNVLGTSSHPVRVDPTGSTTQPVSLATAPVLVAGTAIIGKVGIDQTTPGTTNGVQVNAALPAGTNVIGHVINDASTALIGKVGIDQTTPGTTNAVQDVSDGSVTAGTAASKSGLIGGVCATAAPTVTVGQQIAIQLDTVGNQRISPYGATGAVASHSLAGGAGNLIFTITVPAATKWVIQCLNFNILTNGTAGNRTAAIELEDASSNLLGVFECGFTQPNSVNYFYTAGSGLPVTTTPQGGNSGNIPMPSITLGPGMKILILVSGGLAGDTVSSTWILATAYPD